MVRLTTARPFSLPTAPVLCCKNDMGSREANQQQMQNNPWRKFCGRICGGRIPEDDGVRHPREILRLSCVTAPDLYRFAYALDRVTLYLSIFSRPHAPFVISRSSVQSRPPAPQNQGLRIRRKFQWCRLYSFSHVWKYSGVDEEEYFLNHLSSIGLVVSGRDLMP